MEAISAAPWQYNTQGSYHHSAVVVNAFSYWEEYFIMFNFYFEAVNVFYDLWPILVYKSVFQSNILQRCYSVFKIHFTVNVFLRSEAEEQK